VPQFVTDDGVRIVYQMWNRPTVLPLLVLHHGFTGCATCDWVETGVVAALTAANRTVIAPDARGHGGSDKPHQPSAYGEARMACDLIQLIDTLAFPQIDLLGFSMGAVVALLAATTDQRIRRLAIVGVGAGVVELGGVDRRALPPDALAAALVADDPTAIENPAAAAFRTNAEARGADLVALAAHAQAIHATAIPLHRITAPTRSSLGTPIRSRSARRSLLPRFQGRSSRSWPATTAPRSPIPNSPHASSTSWGTALPRRDGSSYD
jgi:pimeloyl-ACP methyl ester carboxylesterase